MYNSCKEYAVVMASSCEIAEMKQYEEKKDTSHDKPLGFYTELRSKLNYHVSRLQKKGSGEKKGKLQLQYG